MIVMALIAVDLPAQQTLDDLLATGRLKVTTSLSPQSDAVATQKVVLSIEIATDRWFAGGTKIGSLEVNNAIVLQRQVFAVNSTRRERGQTWAVQRWAIDIFPRSQGTYLIPAVELDITVSGDLGRPVRGKAFTAPASFTAYNPPGAPENMEWIATTELSVSETWDKPLEGMIVGNARQRTITIKVKETPGMLIPELPGTERQGISSYPKPPRVLDNITSRSGAEGIREESVSYFFEQADEYVFPEIQLHWWNLEENRWEIASIQQSEFTVAANPDLAAIPLDVQPGDVAEIPVKRILMISMAMVLLLGATWLLVLVSRRWFEKILPKRSEQHRLEKIRWKELRSAIASGNPIQIFKALYAWIAVIETRRTQPTLAQFAHEVGSDRLEKLVSGLHETCYSIDPPSFHNLQELQAELVRARRIRSRAASRSIASIHKPKHLGSLNPN
jgi:hypothetical protein